MIKMNRNTERIVKRHLKDIIISGTKEANEISKKNRPKLYADVSEQPDVVGEVRKRKITNLLQIP
jgi:hypothetical protein